MPNTEVEKQINKLKFVNPYNDPGLEVQQVVADISVSDYNFIKCVRPRNGTLTGVVCILWKKLVEECRARGITDFNQVGEFEKLVLTCKLVPDEELELLKVEAARASLPKTRKGAKVNE